MTWAACTVTAKRHLALARVLASSFRRLHPRVPFFVLSIDEPDGWFDPDGEDFEFVWLADVGTPHVELFRFGYDAQELAYASTPYLLRALLDRGFRRVVFLKEESMVVGDLEPALRESAGASITLTPHLLSPLEDGDAPARELEILRAGAYNAGFVAVANDDEGRRFLDWWADRVSRHCELAVAEGIHFEQRWLDLVPSYFDGVHLLRDPGVNVAHWNLPERRVRRAGYDSSDVVVDGRPGRSFRFSGFDWDDPGSITRHTTRVRLDDVGEAAAVFARYRRRLAEEGHETIRAWPYSWACFDNGVRIPRAARRLLRRRDDGGRAFGNPFEAAGPRSFLRWLLEPEVEGAGLSRLWRSIYDERPDLNAAFPDPAGADRGAFAEWTRRFGMEEHGLAAEFGLLPGEC